MATTRRRYEIDDEEWKKVKELLPPERSGKPGRPSSDNRVALNGILWIVRSGAPWRDLPERYGSWSTLYDRFRVWEALGVFERILQYYQWMLICKTLPLITLQLRCIKIQQGLKRGCKC